MRVSPTTPKVMNHSTCEFRFLEVEAGLKKHEELLKTVEDLSKQLNEMKTKQVRIRSVFTNYPFFWLFLICGPLILQTGNFEFADRTKIS